MVTVEDNANVDTLSRDTLFDPFFLLFLKSTMMAETRWESFRNLQMVGQAGLLISTKKI